MAENSPDYIAPVELHEDGTSSILNENGSITTVGIDGSEITTGGESLLDSAGDTLGGLASSAGDAIADAASSVAGAVSDALSSLGDSLKKNLLSNLETFTSKSLLANLLASTLKSLTPTSLIPNPMHQYASWSYSTSFWWVDLDDFKQLNEVTDIGQGTSFPLARSYVIAEDSGLYPNKRLPTIKGLNYNIQSIEFDTTIAPTSETKSAGALLGSMVIVEPYGVSLIDSLVQMSVNGAGNYNDRPYMIQIDFTGYDDAGKPLPASQTNIYRKRYPIRITGFKVEVTSKGTEYRVEFSGANGAASPASAGAPEYSTVPKNITVIAGTVEEFFSKTNKNSFTSQLNEFWRKEAESKKVQYADTIAFEIDPGIARTRIVAPKQASIQQANTTTNKIDLSSSTFSIPAGTQIIKVIEQVMTQSDYIIGQLGLDKQNDTPSDVQSKLTDPLRIYRTTAKMSYIGRDAGGNEVPGAFDNIRNTYPKKFTYGILQYVSFSNKHPAGPTLADPRPYTVKSYNYLYTGKNTDIVDLKINFDNTFFNAVNVYTNQVAATNSTASTAIDSVLSKAATIVLSPQLLGSIGVIPNMNKIPNLLPQRYKNIVNDQRETIGMNIIGNPAAQTAVNLMRSMYTSMGADMVVVDLTIVGDPTLMKQDDCLYVPTPAGSSIFNAAMSQFDVSKKYGQIAMDKGEVFVGLTINAPLDIDTEAQNKGLMTPPIGTVPSMFSGTYRIIKIKNKFSNGKFEQVIQMNRQPNDSVVSSSALASGLDRGLSGLLQSGLNSVNSTVGGAIGGLVSSAATTVGGLVSSGLGTISQAAGDLFSSTPAEDITPEITYTDSGADYDSYRESGYTTGSNENDGF